MCSGRGKNTESYRKISIVAGLGAILVIALFMIYQIQNYIVYYPTYAKGAEELLKNDSAFTKIEIAGENGKGYVGWLHKAEEKSHATIVYFGGNAESSALLMRTLEVNHLWEVFKGYNFLMVDYPGYGQSDGEPGSDSIFEMSHRVMEYVKNDMALNQKIIVMGFSLGTGVASYAASEYEVDGLILLAPYDSMRNVYNASLNIFYGPMNYLIRNKYESMDYAKKITADTLIIASEDDEVIPFALSENLVRSFNSYVDFYKVSSVGHNELFYELNVQEKISEYLAFCISAE